MTDLKKTEEEKNPPEKVAASEEAIALYWAPFIAMLGLMFIVPSLFWLLPLIALSVLYLLSKDFIETAIYWRRLPPASRNGLQMLGPAEKPVDD